MKSSRQRCLYADVRYGRPLARWTVVNPDAGPWSVSIPASLDPLAEPVPAFDTAVTAAYSQGYTDLLADALEPLGILVHQHQRDVIDGTERVLQAALAGGEHGVSVRTTFDLTADYGIRTTLQVDPDVPYGELRHYPVGLGGGEA